MNAPTTDTQQRIIDAARELIYARSYADVGVAEICEQAGVQKGSFYHFFPSKRDLTLAVLDAHYLTFKEQMVDRAFASDVAPLARLDRFAKLIYEFQKQLMKDTGRVLGCPVGNLANELASHDEPIREKIDQLFHKAQAHVRQVLKEASKAGELPGVNVDATAQAMFAYFEGVMMLAKTQNDPEVLRKLLPAMAQIRIPSQR
jgi:TetR/AcrR family transcriptional repressor of nem operon